MGKTMGTFLFRMFEHAFRKWGRFYFSRSCQEVFWSGRATHSKETLEALGLRRRHHDDRLSQVNAFHGLSSHPVPDELVVVVLPGVWRRAKRLIQRVQRDERVRRALGVDAVAAPRVLGRILHEPSAHRVELDVAAALQQVALPVNREAFKSSLPQMPGVAVPPA